MTKSLASGAALVCLLGAAIPNGTAADPRPGVDWPSFRGHRAGGVAEGFRTPETWDVVTRKGVRWKASVEGLGHSSPVVWGDRIYLTTVDVEIEGDTFMPEFDLGAWRLVASEAHPADAANPLPWVLETYDRA